MARSMTSNCVSKRRHIRHTRKWSLSETFSTIFIRRPRRCTNSREAMRHVRSNMRISGSAARASLETSGLHALAQAQPGAMHQYPQIARGDGELQTDFVRAQLKPLTHHETASL